MPVLDHTRQLAEAGRRPALVRPGRSRIHEREPIHPAVAKGRDGRGLDCRQRKLETIDGSSERARELQVLVDHMLSLGDVDALAVEPPRGRLAEGATIEPDD